MIANKHTCLMTAILGCLIALGVSSSAQAAERRFEVAITNLTASQVFTPIMVASHRKGVQLFTLGQPASVELEILAEAGDTGPLSAALAASPDVLEVTTGGPLPAGQSQTIFVGTRDGFDHVSIAAMLVPTNDAFFAINGVEGPEGSEELTLFSVAYDAGTEANDELCAHIPGPPSVCSGEGFNSSRVGAEGFVHIHRGIHGIGDLSAAVWDWRNPVAKVILRRVR